MEEKEINTLLLKFEQGNCSAEEITILEAWYQKYGTESKFAVSHADIEAGTEKIWARLEAENKKPVFRLSWTRIAAAAVLLICLSAGLYLSIYRRGAKEDVITTLVANDIAPGTNKAYLTLGGGKKISLTDATIGAVAAQSGVQISKFADGQLVYTVDAAKKISKAATEYNTIETPKGGQYQVRLPDGTKVWLNAASVLKFPSTFEKLTQRTVELNGEAYFEVAKDKTHPFIVTTTHQQVEVLGTHFNINSYADEPVTRTTLLEGSVRVTAFQPDIKNAMVLKPGQQSILTAAQLSVKAAYPEEEIAWKDNKFMFDGDDIQSIMRKIERWYDVEVVYEGNMDGKNFEGSISRFKNVSEVLRKLELTGTIHFRIEGRRITVMP